uniref:EF-hand domain-containing protein n=1 Tax=Zooxanthella nutricula TaxID=1333877 RepID=A0A7S2QKR4_9DINO
MKASEAAATGVQAAITAARNFIAQKNLEIKQYGPTASKPAVEEFGKLTVQINAAASRLAQFRHDTEGRKKTALMQEAGEKVDGIEAELKKLDEVIEPFAKEDGEKEESEEAADKMVEQYRATQAAIDEAKKLMLARQKDAAGNTAHTETVKELNKRITAALAAVTNHKKVASVYEGRFLAKKAKADAEETLGAVEEQVKKATDAAAPLLEEGGERFLVGASARTLAQAWRDHMKAKELTLEALFAEVAGGAAGEGIPKDAFVELLGKLPVALEREEIAFSDARRDAIFAHLDKDGDGKVSLAEFKDLFMQRFKVTKEITVTDLFDVAKSKSLFKVTDGEILETVHGSQTDESSRMTRIECTIVSNGTTGFVTMSGNQGTQFVEVVSPFTTFCGELDKNIEVSMKAVQKLAGAFTAKQQELAACKDAPLVEARAELTKLKHTLAAGQQSLQKLKVTVAQEKKAYMAKELKEKNAHIEAKERKAAEALAGPAAVKVEAMDAASAALEEAVKTLVSLAKDELLAFSTPLSVSQAADRLADEVAKSIDAAKEAIAAQQGELPKEVKGPMADAKRELMKMGAKAEQARRKCKSTLESVKAKCQLLVDACSAEVSGAMRSEMLAKGVSVEAYFLQLVAAGDDRISHEAFCKHVEGLVGEAYRAEHVGLLCRHIEASAIGRRRFQAFLQRYFVVVKGIAITDELPISTAKTLRKAEVDEVIELLEGPKVDEKLGMSRIRGKSLVDSLEGWISLKGNQGTPFLQEVEKPFYACQAETRMEKDFKRDTSDEGLVRALKADEVLELLEGPRKHTFSPGVRVKGKAISDGAVGWFTARDKAGAVFAEADGKYYSCTSSVAMTDDMDIKECKVLRKLAIGELFTLEEGPQEEKSAGITRVKGKALKDELVGWITIKGNAGTVYAEASTKHFCVLHEVPLTKNFPSASSGEEVRKLAKGEAMQVLEGPKEESFTPEVRVKVKALTDGAVGWITQKKDVVKPWTPYYTCKVKAQLQESLAVEGATAVREIQVGERLELVEGPAHDGKVLRVKARADKDGAVGWVTVKDSEGKRYFTS